MPVTAKTLVVSTDGLGEDVDGGFSAKVRPAVAKAARSCQLGLLLVSFGLSLGLGGCSFNLPARDVCGGAASCVVPDGGTMPPDMAVDPSDPGALGPYKQPYRSDLSVPMSLNLAGSKVRLYEPSEDGVNLSAKQTTYPLILMAPSQYLDVDQLAPYATRLASHGFLVVVFKGQNESDQPAYRTSGLQLLNHLMQDADPTLRDHIDKTKLGFWGYQLGATVSTSMAAQDTRISALMLIDPVRVISLSEVPAINDIASVQLLGGGRVLILGEDASKASYMGASACTPAGENYEAFFAKSKPNTISIAFPNSGISDFVQAYPELCGRGSMSASDTQELAIKYTTAYFQWTLQPARVAAQDYLLGAAFGKDASQFMLNRQIKM